MNKERELERQKLNKRQKAILKILNEKLQTLSGVLNMESLKEWHLSLVTFASSFLDTSSQQYSHIYRNTIWNGGFAFGRSFEVEKNNAKTILESLINAITINGIQKSEINSGISVNNNTTVTQTTNIDVAQTVREELGNAKIRELDELVKTEKDKESKFKVVANALKDFGIETLSSTLAKIILPYLGK